VLKLFDKQIELETLTVCIHSHYMLTIWHLVAKQKLALLIKKCKFFGNLMLHLSCILCLNAIELIKWVADFASNLLLLEP